MPFNNTASECGVLATEIARALAQLKTTKLAPQLFLRARCLLCECRRLDIIKQLVCA
jgi:hypothetical protein